MTWIFCVACSIVWFFVGYVVARVKKVTIVRADADVDLLDKILKLDRALYHENDWLDHKSEGSPHIGLWLYKGDEGQVHADNRYRTNDNNRVRGATAGGALLSLYQVLKARAAERRRSLEEAS